MLYQDQYLDTETELVYNYKRYYSQETGAYISQDPIGLAGGNPTIYGYVKDPNIWVDIFGLDCSHESGERGINKAKEDLAKAGFTDIETEVLMSVNGSDKRIRADITARDSDDKLHVFEVKNNSGTLTPNQTEANVFSLDNDRVANPNNGRDIDTSRGVTADYKIATSRKPNAGEKNSTGSATFHTLHYSDE
ncbi:RHS repeat-associated protein [Treponema pedis]